MSFLSFLGWAILALLVLENAREFFFGDGLGGTEKLPRFWIKKRAPKNPLNSSDVPKQNESNDMPENNPRNSMGKSPKTRAQEIIDLFSPSHHEDMAQAITRTIEAAEAPLLARIKEAEQSVERLCETTTNQQTRIIELLQKQDNLESLLEAKDARIKELEDNADYR